MKAKSNTRRKRQPSAAAQEKRRGLCLKSKEAKMILKKLEMLPVDHPLQECTKVNDVLRFWHREATNQLNPDCWNTFQGWKQKGFLVKKGESGFLIWGTPRKMKGKTEQPAKDGSIEEIEEEYKAFPLCYLFHAGQVKDENDNGFNPNCPLQKLALIPAQVKRMPLLLPAPKQEPEPSKAPLDDSSNSIMQVEFGFDEPASEPSKHRGRADYYDRQAAKLERAEEMAAKHNTAIGQRYGASKKILDFIPPGQPILVGHHSEKRHRADLERVDNHMRKAIEHDHKAKHYAGKAASIKRALEGEGPISSDAPDAVERLQEKIEEAEKLQSLMKSVNAAIRKHKKAGEEAQFRALVKLDLSEAQAKEILKPDCYGGIGFAAYRLQNNNANIRRMKKRVKSLEAVPGETTEGIEEGVKIIENVEENRIQLIFDGKPPEETRNLLKRHGFRWSRNAKEWQRLLNNNGRWAATRIIQALQKLSDNQNSSYSKHEGDKPSLF